MERNDSRKDHEQMELVAAAVVDSCLRVHRKLGPGLMESTYQVCFAHELQTRGHRVEQELILPVRYRSIVIETGYRIDMIIDDAVLIENKAVQALLPVHEAQLLTYLRLSSRPLGFLINWNVPLIKDGIKRLINNRKS